MLKFLLAYIFKYSSKFQIRQGSNGSLDPAKIINVGSSGGRNISIFQYFAVMLEIYFCTTITTNVSPMFVF
jgi:hypothetical protein